MVPEGPLQPVSPIRSIIISTTFLFHDLGRGTQSYLENEDDGGILFK